MYHSQADAANDQTYMAVQRFLYKEARLLDSRQYNEWLELLAPEVRYCVFLSTHRDLEAAPLSYAIIDEDFTGLKSRVDQISNYKLTRAENPPSLFRRLVSNIEAFKQEKETVSVLSSIFVHRLRPDAPSAQLYAASRVDILRPLGNSWCIEKRHVQLDHSFLSDGSLTALL